MENRIFQEILEARRIENKHTLKVLNYLLIIDRDKLYVEKGYSTLFTYCVQELDYSKSEAAIRVNAVRLMKNNSGTKQLLDTNQLSLTNASNLQNLFRQEKLSNEKKKEIIEKVKNKSKREAQRIIHAYSSNGYVERKIVLKERLIKKIELVQDILGGVSEVEALEILLDEKIREYNTKREVRTERGSRNQRYISRKAKELVFKRDKNQCQNCGSRLNLQIDHIRSISLGGRSIPENLQLLCFQCNQRKYIKTKTSSKMLMNSS